MPCFAPKSPDHLIGERVLVHEANLIELICDDGIEAARLRYNEPSDKLTLAGAMAGFDSCRGLTARALQELSLGAAQATLDAMNSDQHRYWYWRTRQLKIDWVRNVLGCARANAGLDPLAETSAHGMIKATAIIGIWQNT